MVTKEDIEGLAQSADRQKARPISEVEPGLWVVKPSGELDFSVVVNYSPPVVLLRVKVMTLPIERRRGGDAEPPTARAQRHGPRARLVRHRRRTPSS